MKKNIQTTLIALFALLPLGMQAQSVVTKELYEGTQILNSDFEDYAYEQIDAIEHVIIADGVTTIGEGAF